MSSGGRRRPAARLRAQPAVERRLRHRPGHADGGRQVPRRPQPAARRAVVGHAHALGRQQCREHEGRQPHAGRSAHRQSRQADPGRRPVQHVFLAGRQVGDRRRRSVQAARLPRPATMAMQSSLDVPRCGGINHADFSIDGRFAIFTCEFTRHGGEDRSRQPQGARLHPAHQARAAHAGRQGHRRPRRGHLHDVERHAAGRSRLTRRQDVLRRGHDVGRRARRRRRVISPDGLHPDRRRRPRALSRAATARSSTSPIADRTRSMGRPAARAACP